MSVRVLDLGLVSPVRSQTIYHAVGHTMTADSPDTIILVAPTRPYVCIGYHQDLAVEVDTAYCAEAGLPIYRREVGGGAVYLDRGQVFVQWIFHRDRLPAQLNDQFELYVRPLVETYQSFGIEAHWRPVNDIHVGHRKIGGTGAADMGESRVLVGSIMFDFDAHTMARVIRVPSEKMRDKVFASLDEYVTSMTDQLPVVPDRDVVVERYLSLAAAALGRQLDPGRVTTVEATEAARLDDLADDEHWLHRRQHLSRPTIKIHEDVHLITGMHKAAGGLIRVMARVNEGLLEDVMFTGDFTLLPAETVTALEMAATRADPTERSLNARFARVYEELGPATPGVAPADFTQAILAAVGTPSQPAQ